MLIRGFMLIIAAVTALLVVNVAMLAWQNQRQPSLGVQQGRLLPLSPKPNAVSSQALDSKQRVDPLPPGGSLAQSWAALDQAIAAHGGARLVQHTEHYRHYVFTTPRLRFNDDVEFLWLADEGLHLRSASRAGYSDMGTNARRIDALRQFYLQALEAQ